MIRFDEQPVVQAPVDSLDPTLCERFRTTRTRDEGLGFFEKLGLAAFDDEGVPHPSVSGILMACGNRESGCRTRSFRQWPIAGHRQPLWTAAFRTNWMPGIFLDLWTSRSENPARLSQET